MLYPVKDTDSDSEGDGVYESEIVKLPEAFDEIFTHFRYARNNGVLPTTRQASPSLQRMIAFSLGNNIKFSFQGNEELSLKDILIVGPIKGSFQYTFDPGAEMIVANFREDAFYRFFGQSLQSISAFDQNVQDSTTTELYQSLWGSIKQSSAIANKIRQLLDFIGPYLKERESGFDEKILHGEANAIVKDLPIEPDNSEQAVQLHYKKHFGYSDKEITRYQRFQKALELVEEFLAAKADIEWFEIIYGCGYHDQTHLIHDFKYYIGVTPMQYVKLQEGVNVARF